MRLQAAERIQTVKHLEDQLGVVLKPRVQHAIQNETISALQVCKQESRWSDAQCSGSPYRLSL